MRTAPGDREHAADARENPKVALLFAESTGCGMDDPPQVLVQGTADVARADVVRVRPERVFVWPRGDATREPQLFDAHMEEVRSGHDEEPAAPHAGTEGGTPVWDARMDQLGGQYPDAVLSLVAPDGFPFSVRVPISVDRSARRIRLGGGVLGVPVQPGLACATVHDHAEDFSWQRNFQIRGDLVEENGGWVLVPHRLVGGLELPPVSKLELYRMNARKMLRFWRTAKKARRELSA